MKTIGIILNTIISEYEEILWRELVYQSMHKDYNVIYFSYGGYQKNRHYLNAQRNSIIEFIDQKAIDGLIVFSAAIGFMATPEDIYEFLRNFKPIPLISIGYAYDDIPSITISNTKGFSDILTHLITTHQYRDIAYISGPPENRDARERLQFITHFLHEHNIPLKKKNIAYGNFCEDGGRKAVQVLLDENKASFTCLVCANDATAFGAMEELTQREYSIPGDIAVTGFDDVKEAGITSRMLTTIRPPYEEIAQHALQTIIALTDKTNKYEMHRSFHSNPVLRRSCGCSNIIITAQDGVEVKKGISFWLHTTIATILRETFLYQNIRSPLNVHTEMWIEILAKGLQEAKNSENSLLFLQKLETFLGSSDLRPDELFKWQEACNQFFLKVKDLVDEQEKTEFLLPLHQKVTSLFNLYIKSYFHDYRLDMKYHYWNISMFNSVISGQFDVKENHEVLQLIFPQIGINYFYLVNRLETDPEYVRIHFMYENRMSCFNPDIEPIHVSSFITYCFNRINEAKQLFSIPIFSSKEQLGCFVVDISIVEGQFYELLGSYLNDTIHIQTLIKRLKDHVQNLEKKVDKRTEDLQKMNNLLHKEINKNKQKADELAKKNKEIQRLNKILDKKSKTDKLTKLYNRYAFYDLFEKELLKIKSNNMQYKEVKDKKSLILDTYSDYFSIILIDIDHFKKINDTYGHLFGDKVLQELSTVLKDSNFMRTNDIAVRYGGEEFILLLTNTNSKNAHKVAKRIKENLTKIRVMYNNKKPVTFTVSMGIAEYRNEDQDIDAIIQRADTALYYAKQHGRNLIISYEDIKDKIKADAGH